MSALILLCGCGPGDLTGRLEIPGETGRDVDVLLLEGNVFDELDDMAVKYREQIAENVGETSRPSLHSRLEDRRRALEEVEAELAATGLALAEESCTARARASLEQAEEAFQTKIESLAPSLRRLDVDPDQPTTELASALQERIDERLEDQAEELRRAYVRQRLEVHSAVVFGTGGPLSDRLCLTIVNRGDLAVAGLERQVSYRGQALPIDMAKRFWILPEDFSEPVVRVRNVFGEEVRGLPPDNRYERCYPSRKAQIGPGDVRRLADYGLSRDSDSRSGRWSILVSSISLSPPEPVRVQSPGSPMPRWEYPPAHPVEIFPERLGAYQDRLEETRLLAELTASTPARTRLTAREQVRLCERRDALREEIATVERALRALDDGSALSAEDNQMLSDLVAQEHANPARRERLVGRAFVTVERHLYGIQKTNIRGEFTFRSVPDGRYTILVEHESKRSGDLTWFFPVRVEGDTQVALDQKNVHEGELNGILEKHLFQGLDGDGTNEPEEASSSEEG